MSHNRKIDQKLLDLLKPDAGRSEPLYTQVARAITKAIGQGMLKPGDYLLPQRELASVLDVSRVTIRKAIDQLAAEGLLSLHQGDGTRVAENDSKAIHKNLAVLNSFTEDMKSRGFKPSSTWLQREKVQATPNEAMALNLSLGEPVIRLTRIRYTDKTPMAYEIACIPAAILGDPGLIGESLYDALSEKGCGPVRAMQSITARCVSNPVAEHLNTAEGEAVLYIERQGYDSHNRLVEFTRSWYRSDIYDFVTELRLD